jgi:hypothetical protein
MRGLRRPHFFAQSISNNKPAGCPSVPFGEWSRKNAICHIAFVFVFLFQIEQSSFRPEQLAFFASCGVEKSASLPRSLARYNAFVFPVVPGTKHYVHLLETFFAKPSSTMTFDFAEAFLQPAGNLPKASST